MARITYLGRVSFPVLASDAPDDDAHLRRWRANVGATVALDLARAPLQPAAGAVPLLALSWNVWIGRGRLAELVARLRAGAFAGLGAPADAPLVVLVQEAYRADDTVPPRAAGAAVGGGLGRRFLGGEDVVLAAEALGMSLRYAPSMRNGRHRSDRGNAVLSTLPIVEAYAVELPALLQRRVAVGVTLALDGDGRRLRCWSVHLDPRGPAGRRWLGAAGRGRQVERLLAAIDAADARAPAAQLIGADLNLGRGRREPAWRYLEAAGFGLGLPPRVPLWGHTFHALPRLTIDYLLVRDAASEPGRTLAGAEVHRLDEHPRDQGRTVFGSDHHPLLARVELRP
jgi:endonuclease/exonuclease/phosphatase family metal-dependent hydrolase